MSTVLEERWARSGNARRWGPWLALALAWLLLYVPVYVAFAHGIWHDAEYAHAPLVIAASAWLAWREREALQEIAYPAPVAGGLLLAAGLALYVVGRSQSIALFAAASQLPVAAGALLAARGPRGHARFGFAVAFLAFSVPLPGFVLTAATQPLALAVSAAVASILSALGYPVLREGVVLTVGNQPLLVADACAGLHSIVSLLALAAFYAHLTGGVARKRGLALLAAALPIAFIANILRVTVLALIAYHLGDEAAQGYLHEGAGLVLFVVALALLFTVDRWLGRRAPPEAPATDAAASRTLPASSPTSARTGAIVAVVAAATMAGAAFASPLLVPVASSVAPDLERLVPTSFGTWRLGPVQDAVAPTADAQERLQTLYGQVLSRQYVSASGEQMMLVVAYGGDQSDALKVHRQEACYAAQGFEIQSLSHGRLDLANRSIPVTRMLAVRGERFEPVTYWFTMGDQVVLSRLERLRVQLAMGLAGRVPDGMLVRVSSLSPDSPAAFAAQRDFLAALVASMPAADAARFAGRTGAGS